MRAFACILLIAPAGLLAQTVSPRAESRIASVAASDQSLRALSDSIETIARKVNSAVVQIFATGYVVADEDESGAGTTTGLITKARSSGSGVVLSPDGYIVTNNHVVRNARHVRVQLAAPPDNPNAGPNSLMHAHGKLLEAKVVGVDHIADLAVLKVDPPAPLAVLKLGDSDRLRQGQVVLAFGNPLGLENSVSLGIVSSLGRQIKPDDPMTYIQTDAPINPGNSGGPLLDAAGTVVGINTFILTQSGGSEGIGFAIPSNVVTNVYEQIRKTGHVHRGEIGVSAQSITPDLAAGLNLKQDWGVILGDVDPAGPAAQAGLETGDIVVSLNHKRVENAREFLIALYNIRLNDSVNVEVLRGAQTLAAQVKVTERDDDPFRFVDLVKPEDNQVQKLGIVGVPITQELQKILPETRKPYGIIVAARAGQTEYTGNGGLKLGDVIYAVNTTPVATLEALRNAISHLRAEDPLVLQIEREGKLLYLALSGE